MIIKNLITNTVIVFIGLAFISCTNMTIGFEEDSPLYNGPLIDTREEKTVESQDSQKSEELIAEEKTVKELDNGSKTTKAETSTKQEEAVNQETTIKEKNETTFSYNSDDGY
ncbi:MAG: hypothetical protein ABFQ64_09480 [Campylobacterota bacterium]